MVSTVQVLVDCVKANGTNGCSGGDPTAAYSYILEHGIPDETCSNYEVSLQAMIKLLLSKRCTSPCFTLLIALFVHCEISISSHPPVL